jgi:hypothetical protein
MNNSMKKQRPAREMLVAGLCMAIGTVVSHAATNPDVIASDPCVLVTAADLRAVLGVTFPRPNIASDVDSRTCSYEGDKFLISVYTGNEELTEFQKDSNEAKKRHDTWGKTIKVSNVSVPYYQSIGEGRLIVWKNKTRFTVGVQDVTFSMSDEALEAAREQLINIGLSRIK